MIRSLLLLAVAASLAACGAPGPRPPDAATNLAIPSRELSFDPAEVRAEPGARVAVTIALRTHEGAAVANEEVRLALPDASRDASLSQTRVITDAAGRASFEVIASSVATTFRVRATVAPAYTFYLVVSVSDRGFGSVSVTSRYVGVRGPDQLALALYHGPDCAALDDSAEPVRTVVLGAAGGQVTFGSLGAGQSFTVQGSALGANGDALATGCVDGLVPTRDGDLATTLSLMDQPLGASGSYRLALAYDLGALPETLATDWTRAVAARAPMGDAVLVLDAISDAIAARAGAAAQLDFDRSRDRLTSDLRLDLARRAASPLVALNRLATDTAAVVEGVDAVATLDVSPSSGLPALVTVRDVTYTLDPLTPDVESDDLTLPVGAGGAGTVVSRPGDRAAVALQNLRLPFTDVARRAADALLARLGVASATEWAQVTLRCGDVVAVVGTAAAADGCSSACVVTACNAAAAQLGAAFDAALAGTGSIYQTVAFTFEGGARGVAGTLRIQSVEPSAFTGSWLMTPGMTVVPVVGVARMTAL